MQFTLSGNLFWMIEIEGALGNKLLTSRSGANQTLSAKMQPPCVRN